ncbi:type II toxin-antitoxin system RelE family toxin [Hydrogenimonas sp.]
MPFSFRLHPAAKKELEKFDLPIKRFILTSLREFIDHYDPIYERELMHRSKIKKLKGEWEGYYRLRLRNYRVIYEKIDEELVIHIVRVAHRKEVY